MLKMQKSKKNLNLTKFQKELCWPQVWLGSLKKTSTTIKKSFFSLSILTKHKYETFQHHLYSPSLKFLYGKLITYLVTTALITTLVSSSLQAARLFKLGQIKCCKERKITAPPNKCRNIPFLFLVHLKIAKPSRNNFHFIYLILSYFECDNYTDETSGQRE